MCDPSLGVPEGGHTFCKYCGWTHHPVETPNHDCGTSTPLFQAISTGSSSVVIKDGTASRLKVSHASPAFLKMSAQRQSGVSRVSAVIKPITGFFKGSKTLPAEPHKAIPDSLGILGLEPATGTAAQSLPDRSLPRKRKRNWVSTNSSPTTSFRPRPKRQALFSRFRGQATGNLAPVQSQLLAIDSVIPLPAPTTAQSSSGGSDPLLHQAGSNTRTCDIEDPGSTPDTSTYVSTDSLASRSSARARRARAKKDHEGDARRVLRTVQQVQEGNYSVQQGGKRGRLLVQRTLQYPGYRHLCDVELKKNENRELEKYFNGKRFR